MKASFATPTVRAAVRPTPANTLHAARIAVAGMGFVTPLGHTLADFDEALFNGRSAIRAQKLKIGTLDEMTLAIAACDFDDSNARSTSRLPLDRGTAMAIAAAKDAWTQSGIGAATEDADTDTGFTLDGERLGVYWGSGMAGSATFDNTARSLYSESRRVRPTTVLTTMPNAAAAEIALLFGARGAALTYACACASSAVAIGEAMRAIRGGWIDVAIVGGHESMLTPATLASWHSMRVTAPPPEGAPETACRPFSADRTGFALGEGAAALVIESEAHARARGASPSMTLSGYATNCDSVHMTNPDPGGQARAMRAALKDAGLRPEDIGYINAHGTATGAGDAAEAASIHAVFGGAVPVSSTKAIHGHLLGGGGVLEAIVALRALAEESLPPNANLETPDPAFAIDLVCGSSRAAPGIRHAMSNSFAFGGTNAVLIASHAD
ncbi:beta-ketoacyl-[acyl-carrier-protein] synthase family protein [Variovorax sp. RHLX14]|uniref:beta-ketoacyl-[acyl-carrier-protein] synthase family protein n=1 Tax=Variovorax sp. RHLX14 TaxID=1259731 RepID=UPI003F48708A